MTDRLMFTDFEWLYFLYGDGRQTPKGLLTVNRRAAWEDAPPLPSRQVRRQTQRLAKKGRKT